MKKNNKKIPGKKNKSVSQPPVAGILDMARSGIGYVIINDHQNDIFINRSDLNTALDGDKVLVKIVKKNTSSGRVEGRVVEVIERKTAEFMGVMHLSEGFGFVEVFSEKIMPDFFIPGNKLNGAKDGSKVLVKFIKWESADKKPEAEVIRVVNPEDESDIAMRQILTDAGFEIGFSQKVMQEADALSEVITEEEIAKRRDFRDVLTFTIDPADAKDFDDAISLKKIDEHWFEVGVHIADVSHYVRSGTALDEEAYKRATSVYLPDRVNPMLPEHISNVLCSLRPNEEKLAYSAVFVMNKTGAIRDTWIGRTVILSDRRYTYEEAQQIIDTGTGDYADVILLLNEITQKIRAKRFESGAINFSSIETRFILDENAKPIGITVKESKPAHQLIEELMLYANKAVAAFVAKRKVKEQAIPFPYRVHDKPDEDKLQAFLPIAMKFGFKFDLNTPKSIAMSFNEMLHKIKNKPEMQILEQLGVRAMAKAIYTTHNIGHYGLGFEDYCHFTSPIRRYPDVMVHRILDAVLTEQNVLDKELEEKCNHCSERERAAMECEREADKYKQIEFMRERIGENFEAVISGVASFGFWAETLEHHCEGMVSTQSLANYDTFEHVESEFMLRGIRTGKTFKMGDKVMIKVVAANLDKRHMDYEWIPCQESTTDNNKPVAKKKATRNKVGQKKEKK